MAEKEYHGEVVIVRTESPRVLVQFAISPDYEVRRPAELELESRVYATL